jgi:topoisomerase IA-like protein
MPNSQNIKLAALYMDRVGNKYAGLLVNPLKIQNINKNQGLFTIELDEAMRGVNPITGKSATLTKINGLALYNNGDKPIQFKSGNIAALTATLTK